MYADLEHIFVLLVEISLFVLGFLTISLGVYLMVFVVA